MQPILILGLVAAAAITMSSGFLLTDQVQVWLQGVGTGKADAANPVDHVSVDIDIDKVTNAGPDQTLGTPDDFYDNIVTECSFHIAANDINDQDMNPTDLDGIEEVICKLTENGVTKGEGSKTFRNGGRIDCTTTPLDEYFCPSRHYVITNLMWADGTPATISQWTDVRVVVRGENPTIQP
jgi:hypothetical protein